MSPKFQRRFVCRDCDTEATVDMLTPALIAVECPKCNATELWGYEATVCEAPEYFYILPVADC
jgi:hypothetical protein